MDQIDKEKSGRFIAERRKELGLTQKELAEKLFLSDKAVSKWERGLSLPDVGVLQPLSGVLEVTLTELLRGEWLPGGGELPAGEVESLVAGAVELSAQTRQARERSRRRWKLAWVICTLLCLAQLGCLMAAGFTAEDMKDTVLLMALFGVVFGGWACFFAKETLPAYYDTDRISAYSQGPFRMNLPGVRFNNSNWPHILNAIRGWFLAGMVLYPPVWGIAMTVLPASLLRAAAMTLTLVFCLGFLAVAVITGKRYE